MATKLYFHRTEGGWGFSNLPTSEQSSLTADSNLFDNEDGTENRQMDTNIGTSAQTSLTNTSTNDTNAHNYYIARWVSRKLNQTSIAANTWDYKFAAQESNANANFPRNGAGALHINCYVWRTSNGTKVGTILDGNSNTNFEEASTSQTLIEGTFSGSAVSSINTDDDVIIFEAWAIVTQGMATAYTQTYFYDGTTESSTSNNAAFIGTPETIAFITSTDFPRNLSDTVTVGGGTLDRVYAANRGSSDTTTSGETLDRKLDAFRTLPETTSSGETLDRSGTFTRTLSDTVGSSELLERIIGFPRAISEAAISVGESLTRLYGANRSSSDTIGSGETLDRRFDAFRKAGTGWSIQLDGVDDTINLGNHASLWSQSHNKFSVSCWIYVKENQEDWIMNHWDGDEQGMFALRWDPGFSGLVFVVRSATTPINCVYQPSAGITSLLNKWIHLTGTFDESLTNDDNLKLYVDAIDEAHATLTDPTKNLSGFVEVGGDTNWMNMNIKDIRFWNNTELTPTQVQKVKDNDPTAPAPNYWLKMREGTGTPVDSIGSLTTTLNGATWHLNCPEVWIYDEIVVSGGSVERTIGFPKTIVENAISIVDDLVRSFTGTRTLSDTTGSGETLDRRLDVFRSSSDTTGSSDSVQRVIGFPREIIEAAISVGESLARRLDAFRSSSDTTGSGESLTRSGSFSRSLSDTTGSSDLVDRIIGYPRAITEATISVIDSVARRLDVFRSSSDTTGSSDSVDRRIDFSRSLSDTTSTNDLVNRAVTLVRALSDATGIGDAVTRVYEGFRGLSDTIVSSDSVQRAVALFRGSSDTASSGEQLNRSLAANRSLSDTTTSSEDLSRSIGMNRSLSDTISIDGIVSRIASLFRSISQAIGISELLEHVSTGAQQKTVVNTDIPILITEWLANSWTNDPASTVEHYLIPPKNKITFGSRFDMSAGTHSDMHVHVRNVNKNIEQLSTDGTVEENSAIVNIHVEVRYIPDTPPDFSGINAGAPSDMMWQIRSYIDELIRSDPEQLLNTYGIEIISIMQEIPDANTPADVHAQNVIENMYTVIITVKCFYTLDVDRQV